MTGDVRSFHVSEPVDVLLVGIGGYGSYYLRELEHLPQARLCAVVDPMAERSTDWPALEAAGIPCYPSIEGFLEAGGTAELAVIVSPIAFHAEHVCLALAAGMHVLCEKPVSPTLAEAQRMVRARDAAGRFLEIGYQWSYSPAIQMLKADAIGGRLGGARRFLTYVGWPRSGSYYRRNNWAGCVHDQQGRIVYDSPVNNATAHFLHNMLYVAGASVARAATPVQLEAESYRANRIANYDTACCRVHTAEGCEILFYTSHAVERYQGPVFRFEFEWASIEYSSGGQIIAHFKDGRRKNYGDPEADAFRKLRYCLQRCREPERHPSLCGPEAAMSHTACVEAMQAVPVVSFPEEMLRHSEINPDDVLVYLPRLNDTMHTAFSRGVLFSELGLPWTVPATTVEMSVEQPFLVPEIGG